MQYIYIVFNHPPDSEYNRMLDVQYIYIRTITHHSSNTMQTQIEHFVVITFHCGLSPVIVAAVDYENM